jgi:hypothetical protein
MDEHEQSAKASNAPTAPLPPRRYDMSYKKAFPHIMFIVMTTVLILVAIILAANFIFLASQRTLDGSARVGATWGVAAITLGISLVLRIGSVYASKVLSVKQPFFNDTSGPQKNFDPTRDFATPFALLKLE